MINIGDLIHSFHAHNVEHISLGTLDGETWAGQPPAPCRPARPTR